MEYRGLEIDRKDMVNDKLEIRFVVFAAPLDEGDKLSKIEEAIHNIIEEN